MKILRLIMGIILLFVSVSAPFLLYERLLTDEITDTVIKRRNKAYYGVINVWQLDCFEGGTGSRANWLKSVCSGFEKKYNGVYINVEAITVSLANKLISSGQKKPDIISFGMGTALSINDFEKMNIDYSRLAENIRSVCFDGCVPWCMGAYFILGDGNTESFGNDGKAATGKKSEVYSIGIGEKEGYGYREALLSFAQVNTEGSLAVKYGKCADIFDSYNYYHTVNRIVGTQRDLYRLNSAAGRGKAREGDITFIGAYNDLFQYMGILKCDDDKKISMMNLFCGYLLSETVQDRLGEIGMFPVNDSAEPEYNNQFMLQAWQSVRKYDFNACTHIFS